MRILGIACALACAAARAQHAEQAAGRAPKPAERPRVEVCFVLDTTGSMSALIEGAKRKIWSIANEIASAQPVPEVRFALVGYRDRGDAYVTRRVDLTDDLDTVHARLLEFRADGGGDTPESVAEALHEAVSELAWSTNRSVLKLVYLVGDAPPQQYRDGCDWRAVCTNAVARDLIINTVQCGSLTGTREAWQAIAARAEGVYAAIPQDGNMVAVAAPQDRELAELNVAVGATLIPFGSEESRGTVAAKQSLSERSGLEAAASRLAYNAKSGKTVQGGGELVDALAEGTVKLESVRSVDLPESLRGLSREELRRRVDEAAARRAVLRARIGELTRERDAFVVAERRRLAAEGRGDGFDAQVAAALRAQAARKGIRYE